jgi:hypothetical protein
MPLTRHNYGQGDYLLLYDTLSSWEWSFVLNKKKSVDSAVYNLIATLYKAINKAFPPVKT